MRQIILEFLQRQRIRTIIRKEEIKGDINFFLIDFFGIDDKYYSFFVLYNKTQIFCKTKDNLLCSDSQNLSLDSKLQNGLLSFNTQQAYLEGRWDFNKQNTGLFIKSLKDILNRLIDIKSTGDFEIMKVETELRLFWGLIIYYRYKGVAQYPLIYQYDVCNNIKLELTETEAADLKDMLLAAGINNVIWEYKNV